MFDLRTKLNIINVILYTILSFRVKIIWKGGRNCQARSIKKKLGLFQEGKKKPFKIISRSRYCLRRRLVLKI